MLRLCNTAFLAINIKQLEHKTTWPSNKNDPRNFLLENKLKTIRRVTLSNKKTLHRLFIMQLVQRACRIKTV